MVRDPRLGRRSVLLVLLLALVAIGLLAAALNLRGGDGGKAALAMPPLFGDRDLPMVEQLAAPAQARADRMARAWLTRHPVRDDTGFENYALSTVGAPPSGPAQVAELAQLHQLGAHRTPRGVAASVWLEQHGKKDVWKTYVKQYRQFAPAAAGVRAKALYKKTYTLAIALQTVGKARFARPSPYQADPTLHAVNQQRFSKSTKFSYPSKHAVISYAEATILDRLDPHRASEFNWMADEIAYSRMYAGGHYPSDISAGIYLGRLLADYELGVRESS